MKKYLFIDTWNGEGYSDSKAFVEEHLNDQKAKERVLELSKEYMGDNGESTFYVCPHAPSLVSISYTTACSIDEEGEWVDAGMVSVEELKEDFVGVSLDPDTNSYYIFDDEEEWKNQVVDPIIRDSDEVMMGENVIGNCHHEVDQHTVIAFDRETLNPFNLEDYECVGGDGVEHELWEHKNTKEIVRVELEITRTYKGQEL